MAVKTLLLRSVAVIHFIWGGSLLAFAAWVIVSSLRVLPHMSSGTVWTNLPAAMMVGAMLALPTAALGAWIIGLGRWVWTVRPGARAALLLTHGLLLLPGALAVAYGFFALRQAAVSAAVGGGLMGGLGAIPLGIGAAILALAVFSIVLALAGFPSDPGSDPPRF